MSRHMLSYMSKFTRILFHLVVLCDSLRCGAYGTYCYGISCNVIIILVIAAALIPSSFPTLVSRPLTCNHQSVVAPKMMNMHLAQRLATLTTS